MPSVTESRCITNGYRLANGSEVHTATYRVKTDGFAISARDVVAGAQLASPDPVPAYMATFSLYGDSNANAFAKNISAPRPESDSKLTNWLIDVEWIPLTGSPTDDTTTSDDPLARELIFDGEWEEVMVPVEEGWNEEDLPGIQRGPDTKGPIQNAAGQEPSSPIMKPKRIPVVTVQKNYATLEEIIKLGIKYDDALNKDEWYGFAVGTCLYRGVKISRQLYAGGVEYYTGTHRVAINGLGWSYAMVNRGWKYLGPDPSVETNPPTVLLEATTKDSDGNEVPVSEPINLELDGTRTPDGQVGTVINYRTSPKKDFIGTGTVNLGLGGAVA